MEESKPNATEELAKYDEGFVPEYRKERMSVEVVDTGETPDVNVNSTETGREKVVAQTKESQPVADANVEIPEEKQEDDWEKKTYGKIRIMVDGKVLKNLLGAIKALAQNIVFRATKEGLTARITDADHVGMIIMAIQKQAFVEYLYETEEAVVDITVDVDRLSKLMPYSGNIITLETRTVNNKADTKLTVSNGRTKAEIQLLEKGTVLIPRVPQLSTGDFAVLPAKKFREALRSVGLFSDTVKITFDRETVKVSYNSDEEGTETTFTREELKEMRVNKPGVVSYPLDYLVKMINAIKDTDEFRMTLKEDYPTKIDFYLPSGGCDDGIHIEYLLAPRMEQ